MDTTMFGTDDQMFTLEQQNAPVTKKTEDVGRPQKKDFKTSSKRKALYRGNKAFEAFYSSMDKPPEQVPSANQSLHVPIDDVVLDLLRDTPKPLKRAKGSINRTASTKRTGPAKEKDNGKHKKISINLNDRHERFSQGKLH